MEGKDGSYRWTNYKSDILAYIYIFADTPHDKGPDIRVEQGKAYKGYRNKKEIKSYHYDTQTGDKISPRLFYDEIYNYRGL